MRKNIEGLREYSSDKSFSKSFQIINTQATSNFF